MSYSVDDYINAGCMQFEGNLFIGIALHRETNGNICSGCPKQSNCGAERALIKHYAEKAETESLAEPMPETVREEAARRNISIKQVRRERRDR